MRPIVCLFLIALPLATFAQSNVITADIDHFWTAYDSVRTTTDTTLQLQYIQRLYVDRGTPGLYAFIDARDYTARRWRDQINAYPKFWVSIRPNTLQVKNRVGELEAGIKKLRALYPSMRESKIYFAVGCLNSGGTTQADKVLIGTEIASADITTDASELSDWHKNIFKTQSPAYLVLLNIHEYVHTQQDQNDGNNLLAVSIKEGAADFIAELATAIPNKGPYMVYGHEHEAELKEKFKVEMHGTTPDNWLYNGEKSQHPDLGYFMGYSICKAYYQQSADKKLAVKDIIELKIGDNAAVDAFLAHSGYY
jgi:hypothetical protein